MPGSKGNQPISSGSNYNQRKQNKDRVPSKNKKAPLRAYKKAGKEAQKRVDNKQSGLINSLSKQVFHLQMASYGKVQQNFHLLDSILNLEKDRPCCLDLTDFTCGRGPPSSPGPPPVFPVAGAITYQLAPPAVAPSDAAHWIVKPDHATYGANLYWNNQNQDQPDTGAYLAMNATYFVEILGAPVLDNVRVRFDVVSQKPNAILPATTVQLPATPITKLLPDTLAHMRNLANPTVNRINPVYFKKYLTKTVFINSSKASTGGVNTRGTTANKMRFSFTIRPNKLCVQSLTNPQVGSGVILDEDGNIGEQEEVPRGNFGPRNVPATQPLWMIISTDFGLTAGQRVSVNLSRRISWRDHIGSSNL